MKQEVQLEVMVNLASCIWCAPCKAGAIIWVSPAAATEMINAKLARYVGAKQAVSVGPSVTPEAGPTEVKKNRSGGPTDGRSTGSPSSTEHGTGPLSSASAGALVPPRRT